MAATGGWIGTVGKSVLPGDDWQAVLAAAKMTTFALGEFAEAHPSLQSAPSQI